MPSAVSATVHEARLSTLAVRGAVRARPFIVSAASMARPFPAGLSPAVNCRTHRPGLRRGRAKAAGALFRNMSRLYDRQFVQSCRMRGRHVMPEFAKRRIGRTPLEVTVL